MAHRRSFWPFLLRLVVSAACIAALLQVVDFRQGFRIAAEMALVWFALGVVLALLSRYILAYQTAVLFRHFQSPLPAWEIFLATLSAGFYALFLPGDFGPSAIKIYRLGRKSSSLGKVLVSVAAARVVTIITTAALGTVGLVLYHPPRLRAVVIPAIALMAAILASYVLLFNQRAVSRTQGWADAAAGRTGLFWKVLAKVLETAAQCQALPRGLQVRLLLSAAASLAVLVVSQDCFMRSLDIHLSLIVISWIAATMLLIRLIPVSISGIGVREGLLVLFLSDFGIAKETAVGLGMVVFAAIVLMGLLGGLIELWEVFVRKR